MRVHAIILSTSHSWNYSIQERPLYEGYKSTKLVMEEDGAIIGLTDTQYETTPGEICFLKDSVGGYVLEFGCLPEYRGRGLGKMLVDATVEDAKAQGVRRLEYWSQDPFAQKYYARLGFNEIGRHYRFRFNPPQEINDFLLKDNVGVEYVYGVCLPEEWPAVKAKYDIITRHPLEPHICIGYEIRF